MLTYVARNLEPYRGFPSFMRSLPALLAARPQAQVLIVGGDTVSYGARLPEGQSYRQRLLSEVEDGLEASSWSIFSARVKSPSVSSRCSPNRRASSACESARGRPSSRRTT